MTAAPGPAGAVFGPGPFSAPGPFLASAPSASSAGQAVSADRAVAARYEITGNTQDGVHGQIVIANNGSAPVSGWRITVVLPGDTRYQVLNAGNRSAGDALVVAAPKDGQALGGDRTELVTFTARGTTSAPLRFTVTGAARRPGGPRGSATAGQDAGRAAGGQPGTGRDGHDGWPGSGLNGGRFRQGGGRGGGGWGGWPGGGWPGGGGGGGGQHHDWGGDGQHHGWPGGR